MNSSDCDSIPQAGPLVVQVAAAAAVALQQASGDVILEAWSDPSASLTPTAELLQSVSPSMKSTRL